MLKRVETNPTNESPVHTEFLTGEGFCILSFLEDSLNILFILVLQPLHDPIIKNRDKINLKINHSGVSLSIEHKLELSTGKLKLAFLLLNTLDIR